MVDLVEGKSLLGLKPKVYSRRWLVLLYICCAEILITCGWNFWGTITQTMEYNFGWDDSTLADILNVGRSGIITSIIPVSYLLDTRGIRFCIILSLSLTSLCYILRSVMTKDTSVGLAMVSQIFNGVASVVTFNGASAMSVTWFPPDERASATSIAVMCTYLGYGIGYVVHPMVVSSPVFEIDRTVEWQHNSSILTNYSGLDLAANYTNVSTHLVVLNKAEMQTETRNLILTETGIAGFLLLAGVVLLPKAPPTPPSTVAVAARMGYRRVFAEVLRNGVIILLVLYAGILVGIYSSWIAIIDIAFGHLNITQKEAGWLGFFSIVAGSIVGFICARFSDIFKKKLKAIQVFMLTIASLSTIWLSLLCSKIIPVSSGQLYASSIIGCAFLNGFIPLLYEQLCEAAFPVPEGIIVGLSAVVSQFVGITYLLPLSLIPMRDNSWLEWTLFGIAVLGVCVIIVTPQRYGRADLENTMHVRTKVDYEKVISSTEYDKLIPENA